MMKRSIFLLMLGLMVTCDEPIVTDDTDPDDGPPDDTPPSVVISYPADGATLAEADTIRVIATDNDTLESVAILIDGIEVARSETPPFEFYWEVGWWADWNNHTILAIATDTSGNEALSNLVTVQISSAARISPVVVSPAQDSVMALADPAVFAWHQLRDAAQYKLVISLSSDFADTAFTTIVSDTTAVVGSLPEGLYYWRVQGRHAQGYESNWSAGRRFYLAANPTSVVLFTEYEGNPVISTGFGDWNNGRIYAPSVLKEGSTYKMWFSGQGNSAVYIGYATSIDGKSWTVDTQPVFGPDSSNAVDELYVRTPEVIYAEGRYLMLYTAVNTLGHTKLCVATSPNGTDWTRFTNNPVITRGQVGDFDAGVIITGSILYEAGLYSLYYTGGTTSHPPAQFGLATSADGFNWTKYAGNPIFSIDPNSTWESAAVRAPTVFRGAGNKFEMLYSSYTGGVAGQLQIGWASSDDGISWVRGDFLPLIPKGSDNSWSMNGVGSSTVIFTAGFYQIWFDGQYPQSRWQIGYGTAR